jgi:hypothetical protein
VSSSETDTGNGGRPRLSKKEIRARREKIYLLHLSGLRESQIAEHLHLSQSSVSEAIKSVRAGTSWFQKSARERFGDVIDQTRDMALATISESWKMYLSPGLMDKPAVRALWMGRIQSGVKIMAEFVPDAERLQVDDLIQQIKAQEAEWRKICLRYMEKGEPLPMMIVNWAKQEATRIPTPESKSS